jgi:hypothetical protein
VFCAIDNLMFYIAVNKKVLNKTEFNNTGYEVSMKIALYEWSFLIIGMVFGESGGTVAL